MDYTAELNGGFTRVTAVRVYPDPSATATEKEKPMSDSETPQTAEPIDHRTQLEEALVEVKRVIAGQDEMLERVLVCLVAGGHLLIEGVPGLAKTLTVKTIAAVLGGTFRRVQFTPDLVPGDLVGTRIYRADTAASTPRKARSSATSCSPTRSTARRPRCSRRCSRRCRSGR